MKKEGIQTRKRKPKNLNKSKPGMKVSSYTVVLKAGGGETPRGSVKRSQGVYSGVQKSETTLKIRGGAVGYFI